jgi:hypothetical protein
MSLKPNLGVNIDHVARPLQIEKPQRVSAGAVKGCRSSPETDGCAALVGPCQDPLRLIAPGQWPTHTAGASAALPQGRRRKHGALDFVGFGMQKARGVRASRNLWGWLRHQGSGRTLSFNRLKPSRPIYRLARIMLNFWAVARVFYQNLHHGRRGTGSRQASVS